MTALLDNQYCPTRQRLSNNKYSLNSSQTLQHNATSFGFTFRSFLEYLTEQAVTNPHLTDSLTRSSRNLWGEQSQNIWSDVSQ